VSAVQLFPSTVFSSSFRNCSKTAIYVPWAYRRGGWVQPGQVFEFAGDPRIETIQHRGSAASVKRLCEAGVLEWLNSPSPILSDDLANNATLAITSKDGDAYIQVVPVDKTEAEARVLPVITPTLTSDTTEETILVDWTATADLVINDQFYVEVTTPKGKLPKVFCGEDTQYVYTVRQGDGDYSFKVTLKAIDGREQEGTEETETYVTP